MSDPGLVSHVLQEPWLDSSSSIPSSLRHPVLTSTVQKQPGKQLTSRKPADSEFGSDLNEPESEEEFSSKWVELFLAAPFQLLYLSNLV